jgi:hypothetical protein
MNKVFALVQNNGCIAAVNSDAFLTDTAGWTELDAGEGDRYVHAQGNYLPGSLRDDAGRFHYKLVEGTVLERTAAELAADAIPESNLTETEKLKICAEAVESAMDWVIATILGGM